MSRARVGFVIEQALGHVAYGMSLRRSLADRDDMEIVWIEVPYDPPSMRWLPVAGRNWTVRGSLRAAQLVRQAEREAPLDALFLHTQTISLFAAGFMRRIPTLLSLDATPKNVDEISASYGHRVGNRMAEWLKLAAHRRVMRRARAFTTWSEWAKASLVADYGVSANSVTVVHPGTMLQNFPLEVKQRKPGAKLQLLFVGGDMTRKGGDLLVDVFRQSLRDRCDLHLVTTADVAPQEGVHVYRGVKPHSPELLDLYRAADVFVLPTRGDCLAVVLGEAMAAALPIITTNVGAHAEAVEDGASGYVIERNDAAALRDRILALADDRHLVARIGARSRAIGEERFDMAKGAACLGDVLMSIATHQRKDPRPAEQLAEETHP